MSTMRIHEDRATVTIQFTDHTCETVTASHALCESLIEDQENRIVNVIWHNDR